MGPPNAFLNCGLCGVQFVKDKRAVIVVVDVRYFVNSYVWNPVNAVISEQITLSRGK